MADEWWPPGAEDPAFTVQRQPYGQVEGGDYVRARSGGITTLPQAALRYLSQAKGWEDVRGKSLLSVRPHNYTTMEIVWDWPENLADTWLEVALVRSSFGRPTTPNDGVTVFRMTYEEVQASYGPVAPVVFDGGPGPESVGGYVNEPPLLNGRWYYYTLFFKTTPLDWVAAFQMGSPLPKNYGHAEHLWNHLPPWYQFQDDNIRADDGFLRQFFQIFGYELDHIREYVEQWQKLYHIDFSPMRLLRHLGDNFNVAYESGLGDIRYRGLVGNIANLYAERGTRKGLQRLVQAASQYECDVTRGDNTMLIPEDTEFVGGTGNWTAPHPDLVRPVEWTAAPNTYQMTVIRTTTDVPPIPGEGRSVAEVFVTEIPQ